MNKNIIWLICLALAITFTGCNKNDNKLEEDEYESSYSATAASASFRFFGYKLDEVTGYERHSLIEDKNLRESVTLYSGSMQILWKNTRFYYNEDEEKELIEEVVEQGSTVGPAYTYKDDALAKNRALLAGIKNSKLWVGKFDTDSLYQKDQWITSNNIDRNRTATSGEAYYLDRLFITNHIFNKDSLLFISVSTEPEDLDQQYVTSYVIDGDNFYPIDIEEWSYVFDWYEGTLLTSDKNTKDTYYLNKTDGERIETYVCEYGNNFFYATIHPNTLEFITPISYSDFFYYDTNWQKLYRYSLADGGKEVWQTSVPFNPESSQTYELTYTIKEESGRYIFDIRLTYKDETTQTMRYQINADNGGITVL